MIPTTKTRIDKKNFTLIELFITLSILLVIAGMVGVHVKGAIDHHRFQSSVDQFAIQLREMQALAVSYQSDMEVEVSKNNGLLSYLRKSDEPISILSAARVSLKGVNNVLFNEKKNDAVKLTVLASGRIEPAGVLHFQQGDENLWVDFSTASLVKVLNQSPITKE